MFFSIKKLLGELFFKRATAAMAEANRPIVRGYLSLAAIYYAVMVPVHFQALSGFNQFKMVFVSSLATLVAVTGWKLARSGVSSGRLEAIAAATNFSIYLNVMAALHTNFDESNLLYFPMMALAFAFTSVTIRLAIVSISVVLLTLYLELTTTFLGGNLVYGYLGFASAFGGLAFVIFLQRAIWIAIKAKEAAEGNLTNAEGKLVEAERLNIAMRERAMTDSLTGLPNRRAFFEQLKAIEKRPDDQLRTWLVALDLDGFKTVNDVYGHLVGDSLLKAVTSRMLEATGLSTSASRMGGDEFQHHPRRHSGRRPMPGMV